jgi:hypothetical protein
MADLLIEHMPFQMRLEEAEDGSGKVIARGQFARSDKPTANKRLYREHLWRREFGRLSESIKHRRCMGELDHPADGRTKLQRVSHVITGLKIEGNEVIGEAEVLDTPNGRILKALIKDGVQVGVSSRGYGSVKSTADGIQEVQEDFRLDTFDFVADPATSTAYPGIFTEERQHIAEAEEEMTLEMLKEFYPGLVEEAARSLPLMESSPELGKAIVEAEQRTEDRLREQFAISLRRSLEKLEEDVRDRVRLELAKDSRAVEAEMLVERIYGMVKSFGGSDGGESQAELEELRTRISDKELENQKLSREVQEAKKLAREAAYSLYLERQVSGHPARKAIIELVGKVDQFKSRDELSERIEKVKEELDARGVRDEGSATSEELQQAEETIEELQTMVREKDESLKESKDKLRKTEGLARRAVEAVEQLEVNLHVERSINGSDPKLKKKAERARSLCEGATSIEEADRKLNALTEDLEPDLPKPRRLDEDEAKRIRARAAHKGKERDLHEDTHGSQTPGKNGSDGPPILESFGLGGDEFDRLAGVEKPS